MTGVAVAIDTSVAVPYILRSHAAHADVRRHLLDRRPSLTGHSLAETYSVLTRLPGDARVQPDDAVTLIDANFDEAIVLDPETVRSVPAIVAPLGIAGGAVYDALIALAARASGVPLVTRDRRAAATYKALDARVELIPG